MKKITDLVGLSGDQEDPGMAWEIIAVREGTGKRYPSIRNGVELSPFDPDYWRYRVVTIYRALYLTVTGNPVACESYIREKYGVKAVAINPYTVEIRFEVTETKEILNN